MSMPDNETKITAADCAARTGLTVRALRVYEDFGLIAPERTAGGWRMYGKRELIRLNTITLLKSAGLTLAQIKSVTRLSDTDPSLVHVLQMQVDAWQAKHDAAIRGRALAEAALKNLHTNDSLSIDELCNLVRSLEMSERNMETANLESNTHAVTVSAAILDSYVGHYQVSELLTAKITHENGKLFAERDNDVRQELIAQSDIEFYFPAQYAYIRFVTDAQGRVTEFVQFQQGARVVALRIDVAKVAEMQSRLAAKIVNQTPTTASDVALRRMLESICAGEPNYNEMSAYLAEVVRQQLPILQASNRYRGAILSLEFQGVGQQGYDVYVVHHERGDSQWRISLKDNGVVESAMVTSRDQALWGGLPQSSDQTPGSEVALRRLLAGIREGCPDYGEMSPIVAYSIKQLLPRAQAFGKKMGEVVDIEYQHSELEHHDIYEVKRERGAVRWRISLDQQGIISSVNVVATDSSLTGGP